MVTDSLSDSFSLATGDVELPFANSNIGELFLLAKLTNFSALDVLSKIGIYLSYFELFKLLFENYLSQNGVVTMRDHPALPLKCSNWHT